MDRAWYWKAGFIAAVALFAVYALIPSVTYFKLPAQERNEAGVFERRDDLFGLLAQSVDDGGVSFVHGNCNGKWACTHGTSRVSRWWKHDRNGKPR